MKKKVKIICIVVCLGFTLLNISLRTFAQDNMEELKISSLEELMEFRDNVNSGNTFYGKKISLMCDIDLSNVDNWIPIGNGKRLSSIAMGDKFQGVFDGQNHSIIGLQINTSDSKDDAKGFFGVIDHATVKNIQFKSADINIPTSELGGIAVGLMINNSTVDNIIIDQNSCIVVKEGAAIIGRMLKSGIVQNCINYSNVRASYTGAGIINKAYYTSATDTMTISNCKNYGTVQNVDYSAGGIVAFSSANISECYNEGNIEAITEAGGIVGEQTNYGTIQNCKNTRSIKGGISGGIVGWIRYQTALSSYQKTSTISVLENENSAPINVDKTNQLLSNGGIVGLVYNQANINQNVNTSLAINGQLFAAGIVGTYQVSNDNWKDVNPTVRIISNYSSTPIDKIIGSCKSLYIYDNGGVTLIEEDNLSDHVIKIGSKVYDSLPTAIKNLKENDKPILLKDITLKTITDGDFKNGVGTQLDLNGHTIVGDNGNATLRAINNGKLMISNGSITADNETYCTVIANGAEVELENISLKNSKSNGNSLKCFPNSVITLNKVSSVSQNGGGVEATGGTVNIHSSSFTQKGFFNHNSQIVAASNGGVVNIYDSGFTATSENYGAYVFNSGGTINIYGGQWSASKAVLKADKSTTTYPSKINVYDGTFDGRIEVTNQENLCISKGVFRNTGLSKAQMNQYISNSSAIIEQNGDFIVYPKTIKVKLSETSLLLKKDEVKQLSVSIEPIDTLDKVTWSSSHPNIVSIDSLGKMKGIKEGSAVITATVGTVKAECIVTILKEDKPVLPSIPNIPVEEPTIGITEEKSKEIISETTSHLLESLAKNEQIDESIMSKNVQDKVLKAIQSGKSIITEVESQIIDYIDLQKEDLDKIEEKIHGLELANDTEVFVAQYLDLGIMLKTDDEILGDINKLEEPITFTIAIPQYLKNDKRIFYIVRIHDGNATILETRSNEDGTIMFETDSFSTYALIYEDKTPEFIPNPKPLPDPKPTLPNNPDIDSTQPSYLTPETGDKINIDILVVLLSLSVLCIISIYRKRIE